MLWLVILIISQDKAAQAAAQAAQAAALQTAYSPPPVVGSLTQDQALQLLQRLGVPYPNPPAAAYSDVEQPFLSSNYSQSGSRSTSEGLAPSFIPRGDTFRPQSTFSPFSPDPNSLYTSSDPPKRDFNPYRFNMPKPFDPGFFPQSQDMKGHTGIHAGDSKESQSAVRPPSATRITFAESSDPLATLDGCYGRAEAPISRPNSGQLLHPLEPDPIHDLNGTLASLDLDRPWRSPEVKGKPFC